MSEPTQSPPKKSVSTYNKESYAKLEAIFTKLFPRVFCLDNPVPLAIRMDKQLCDAVPQIPRRRCRWFLLRWCARKQYLQAMSKKGAVRRNLDGSKAGPVIEKHRLFSVTKLAKKKVKKGAKK